MAFVVLGVSIAAVEIVAPRIILLPFGLGAGAAALAGLLGAGAPAQLALFLGASAACILALRPLARRLQPLGLSDERRAREPVVDLEG